MEIGWQKWGTIIGGVAILVSIILWALSSDPSTKIEGSPGSINTINQTGGTNTISVSNSKISDEQQNVLIEKLGSKGEGHSIRITHSSGTSNVVAGQLASILVRAGWKVDYNPSAISITGDSNVGHIDVGIKDVKEITEEEKVIYDALTSANLSFPVKYMPASVGYIIVGDL